MLKHEIKRPVDRYMVPALDKNGRPTGQYLILNRSVIDKLKNIGNRPKVSVH